MSGFAMIWLMASGFAVLLMGTPFLEALQVEAPHVYSEIGSPPINGCAWRRRFFPPFAGMILSLSYRSQLVGCPRSRAWASWLFLALWSQVAAAAALALSLK
ncbi:hypothetical protein GCM10025771_13870 [Niveibacterium umoris]